MREGRSKSLADTATYYYGTGRRKNAVARVRIMTGDGVIVVNDKTPLQYFGRRMLEMVVVEPLKLTETQKRFNISAKVDGGGMSGQAGAVQHGIARALVAADDAMRPVLKKHGMLTRDPRMKERKKPGLKRARKAPQYTKR
jgi:small subunit ribosomal protein S9